MPMPPHETETRRIRTEPTPAGDQPVRSHGGANGRWGPPCLIIVSDRPDLFRGIEPEDRIVLQWRPESAADPVRRFGTLFSGDPTDSATFRAAMRSAGDIVALVDLSDSERIRAVVAALHEAFPASAVVVLSEHDGLALPGDGAVRQLRWSALLEPEIEFELCRMANQRRVRRLREFADGADLLPILIQHEPDPDAIASAFGLRVLLRRTPAESPIVTLGQITRPENRRMADLLGLRVTRVTRDELAGFERIVTTDVQPVDVEPGPRLAVVDHHPPETGYDAAFADIRPEYGATATMVTEYLRATDEGMLGAGLATALLYGIKTDTAALSRGVTSADVNAYAFLQARADVELLGRIERPSYPVDMLQAIGKALGGVMMEDDVAVAWIGELPEEQVHVLPTLADQCLALRGVSWAGASGLVGDELVLTLRRLGNGAHGAGELARRIADGVGSGGGHHTMARVSLPRDAHSVQRLLQESEGPAGSAPPAAAILALLRETIDSLDDA